MSVILDVNKIFDGNYYIYGSLIREIVILVSLVSFSLLKILGRFPSFHTGCGNQVFDSL